MLDFARLNTPEADGQTLIAPSADRWAALVQASLERRGLQNITLAGQPLEAVRDATRRRVWGHAEAPLIVGGHQPAFIHAGVWAKYVAMRAVMDHYGWAGGELIVDNDAPDGMALRVPCIDARNHVHLCQISMAPALPHAAYEGQPPLAPDTIRTIRTEVASCLGTGSTPSDIETYLAGMADVAEPVDWVDQHLAGRRAIDRSLMVDVPQTRISTAFGGPFLADLLIDGARFAHTYNEALAAYRRDHRVRGAHRPLPDLARDGDRIETALWIYQPCSPRRRLWIAARGDRIELFADTVRVGTLGVDALKADADAALAELAPWVIRPRALTLTLWARLLTCELFVHGIGGAKYDRITDRIFTTYYGCDPPPYACVTATLLLPLPHHPQCEEQLKKVEYQLRDLHFNPQRYLLDPPEALLAERSRLIAESARLRDQGGPRVERRRVFLAIRAVNEQLARTDSRLEAQIRRGFEQLHACCQSNRVARDREFFYALHPRDRLERLTETVRLAMRGGHRADHEAPE
jgi:hypothetical protein